MKHTASIPEDEDLRIQDLYSFDLLDTPQEIEFDELLELANGICETPVSFISLIDKDRQWFKASTGIEIKETPREAAFCSHTILQDHVLTVKDATRDERFSDNPLVTNEMGVRFYAGAPIISPNGYALGAVCLMDTKPQEFSPVQERQLELIARQAARLIVLRKQNNQMQKRSQEILSQKSKSLRRLISGHQKSNHEISHSLHEEVAQTIASSKFYLRVAQNNPEKAGPLIDTVIQELEKVISDIRQISYKMAHPAGKILTIGELVKDMVQKMNELFPFTIHLETRNSLEVMHFEMTTLFTELIFEWMHILHQKGNEGDVYIRMSVEKELRLEMKDTHTKFSLSERKKRIIQETIFDQIQAFEGTLSAREKDGVFFSRVTLPIGVGVE